MSIAMAFKGIDGIVLATDSRLSKIKADNYIIGQENSSIKLWKVNDSIGCTALCSDEEYGYWLIDLLVKSSKNENDQGLDESCERYIQIIKNDIKKRSILGDPQIDDDNLNKHLQSRGFYLAILLAGYDISGQYGICEILFPVPSSLHLSPHKVKNSYEIHGQKDFNTYWISKLFLQKQLDQGLSIEAIKKLIVFLITETSCYSGTVGGDIQMAIITKDKGYEPIGMDKIEPLQAEISKMAGFKDISDWICQA